MVSSRGRTFLRYIAFHCMCCRSSGHYCDSYKLSIARERPTKPQCLAQLRTFSLLRSRLEKVIIGVKSAYLERVHCRLAACLCRRSKQPTKHHNVEAWCFEMNRVMARYSDPRIRVLRYMIWRLELISRNEKISSKDWKFANLQHHRRDTLWNRTQLDHNVVQVDTPQYFYQAGQVERSPKKELLPIGWTLVFRKSDPQNLLAAVTNELVRLSVL